MYSITLSSRAVWYSMLNNLSQKDLCLLSSDIRALLSRVWSPRPQYTPNGASRPPRAFVAELVRR